MLLLIAHAVNGRFSEHLFQVKSAGSERGHHRVHSRAIHAVLGRPQAHILENLFNLALGKGIGVSEFLSHALGTVAAA